ncbi:GerMN domain-containing protein [Candidatus Falkowbacteria bacterium]|nr:GerMN domain-containing protein [Candidatus Falkowbacteria bacterium]
MNKTILIILTIVVALGLVIFGIRLWSGEDNWICDDGKWIKHGNPSAAKPNEGCGILLVNQPANTNTEETMTVKVFFGNSIFDPEVLDCQKNFSVERTILKTEAVGRATLEELLAGPTDAEKAEGYFTSINPGVKIQSLVVANGVANVDFDEQLEFQVGGSCRVAAIASEIRETLKQFPTVKDVVISINGRTEDILQP